MGDLESLIRAELASCMPNARSVELPGDHVTAMLCNEFLALVLEVASL